MNFCENVPTSLADADHWCRLTYAFLAGLPTAMAAYSEQEQLRLMPVVELFPGYLIAGAWGVAAQLGAVAVAEAIKPDLERARQGAMFAPLEAKTAIDRVHQWITARIAAGISDEPSVGHGDSVETPADPAEETQPHDKPATVDQAIDGSVPTVNRAPSTPSVQTPTAAGRGGRPRLEQSSDPQQIARAKLYKLILARRSDGQRNDHLANILNQDRDLKELAQEAGFPDGITAEVVKNAVEVDRHRQKTDKPRNPSG
jgi:hypothetical protein